MISKEKRREISNRWRKNNADYVLSQTIKLRNENYEKYMLNCVKRNAKRTGREVTITEDDIVIPKMCPVLGIQLDRRSGRGNRDASPSVDRIDNTKDYVPGNVVVVSMRANQVKGTASVQELEQVLNFYKSLLPK